MIQLAQVQPKAPELTFWEKAIKRYRKEHEDEDSLDCEIRAKLIDANVEQVAKDKPKRESWVAPEHQRDAVVRCALVAQSLHCATRSDRRLKRAMDEERRRRRLAGSRKRHQR